MNLEMPKGNVGWRVQLAPQAIHRDEFGRELPGKNEDWIMRSVTDDEVRLDEAVMLGPYHDAWQGSHPKLCHQSFAISGRRLATAIQSSTCRCISRKTHLSGISCVFQWIPSASKSSSQPCPAAASCCRPAPRRAPRTRQPRRLPGWRANQSRIVGFRAAAPVAGAPARPAAARPGTAPGPLVPGAKESSRSAPAARYWR